MLDQSYCQIVRDLAALHHPNGYEAHPAAPSNLKDLKASIKWGGTFKVSPDHCDNTIYTTPEANHAARAWHDIWHYYLDAEFDTQGEIEVWKAQCRELVQRYRHHPSLIVFLELTTIEVLGQIEYFDEHGHFPPNQRLFAQACLLEGAYRDKALSFLTN